jgi:hypothetical protein
MEEIISFRVVKEPYGWSVRLGQGMMTPFRSRHLAIDHANGFVDGLRRRGEPAEVVVEDICAAEPPATRARADSRRRWGRASV